MINTIQNIVDYITEIVPQLDPTKGILYSVHSNPDCAIRISKPKSFDNYCDIIAEFSLFYKDKLVYDVLIAVDTDLEKFCKKLLKRIEVLPYES